MVTFIIGFIAGFFANWIFGIITRLLPATWVRYSVHLGEVEEKRDLVGSTQVVPVTINHLVFRQLRDDSSLPILIISEWSDLSISLLQEYEKKDCPEVRLR